MMDYSKFKVADLKEELKTRGIPLTGLKLKQNFIDKLLELDTAGQSNGAVTKDAQLVDDNATGLEPPDEPIDAQEEHSREDLKESKTSSEPPAIPVISAAPRVQDTTAEDAGGATLELSTDVGLTSTPVQARLLQSSPGPSLESGPAKATVETMDVDDAGSVPITQTPASTLTESVHPAGPASLHAFNRSSTLSALPESLPIPPPTFIAPLSPATSTPSSIQVPEKELIEDSKKRKRRSVTPPPNAAEVAQKRAKAHDGSPRATKLEAEEDSTFIGGSALDALSAHAVLDVSPSEAKLGSTGPSATETLEAGGKELGGQLMGNGAIKSAKLHSQGKMEGMKSGPQEKSTTPDLSRALEHLKRDPPKPYSEITASTHPHALPLDNTEERSVIPALHPATSSLYMRNFKRPLHLPTLRTHLATLARASKSVTDPEEDPVTTYYLDSIRTHGFVSFTSISAASRVRSALHDTRFPEEKTRDPLWVDFVPDEKIEDWISAETNVAGGRGVAKRWEVVYSEGSQGVEAMLQEVGTVSGPHRAASFVSPGESSMAVAQRPAPAVGVHPDRAPLVPQHLPASRHAADKDSGTEVQAESSGGTGFRALDELFSFTTAKPKLYYKSVSQEVVDGRMDAIKDLRVGHAGMGKSGDEDMKRYTFEVYKGSEEWVDKGPEFGFGTRGLQAMSGGMGGGRGGFRGRGRGRGGGFRDRDDSWRRR